MINRRRALDAGRAINEAAELYRQRAERGLIEPGEACRMHRAARDANAVMFQYYLIPREIRQKYEREELAHGVSVHHQPEGGV